MRKSEDKIILELSKKEVNDLFVLLTEYLDLVKRENGVSRLGKKLREKLKKVSEKSHELQPWDESEYEKSNAIQFEFS